MQSQYPEPGKIHKLPIQVYYNIPSSTHTFITALDAAQPVFVHPAIANGHEPTRSRSASVTSRRGVESSGRKRRKLDGHGRSYADVQGSDSPDEREDGDDSEDEDGEKWLILGSTSLKAVMEAVCKASPELLPSANTSDSSVYIPVDKPKSTHPTDTPSRRGSVAPQIVPKIEPQDPVSTGPQSASLPVPYPYAPVFSPATGQYLYPYAQPVPPGSAQKRNNSMGTAHQASTPAAPPPSSPLPQRTVSNSTTGSQAQTPSHTGLQTPTQAHANAQNGARGSFSGMPPPTGQRGSAATPAPVPGYPHAPPGQPYGYPYSSPYPGYQPYQGYPQYPGHPQHGMQGYPPGSGPVPILVPVPGPGHGPPPQSAGGAPPYPYYAPPGGAYPHAPPPPQHMPGYPYPVPPVYQPPPGQAAPHASDPTGVASTLGIQAQHITFQGKGLLSWILAERGEGKTLVKGKIVRCNDWDGLLGLADADESDQSEDDADGHEDEMDGEGGLEALVKAAARRNERKRKREDRDRDSGERGAGRPRWGVEIRVNLRTVNGPVPSRVAGVTLQPSPTMNPAKISTSQRTSVSASSSARNLVPGRPTIGPGSRAGSALPGPQPVGPNKTPSLGPTTSAGQTAPTKQPATLINGHLQDSRLTEANPLPGASARKAVDPTNRSGPGRQTMPAPNGPLPNTGIMPGSVPRSAGRAMTRPPARLSVDSQQEQPGNPSTLALRRLQSNTETGGVSGSVPTPSITMPAKTSISLDNALRTPPERPMAAFSSINRTPSAKATHLPNVTSGDRVDPLRTPRQATNRVNLPTPKSSPATGLALAKSILRYPASQHTIELAQKLVGKDVFDNIVSEMGLQPADVIRHSPSKNKLSKLSESTNAAALSQSQTHSTTRAKAIDSMQNPLLDPADQARALSESQSKSASKPNGPVKRVGNPPANGSTPAPAPPAVTNAKPKILSCDHCKTTETRVWRVKQLPGGKERRVCDACGLYFNNTKKMRPKELWGTQQIELPGPSVTTRKQAAAATSISKGSEPVTAGEASGSGQPPAIQPFSAPQTTMHDPHGSPQRRARPSTGNAPDSVNWTPRRSSRLNPNADSSPTGRGAVLPHKPALDEACDAAMSPRRSTRLTPRKVSKGKNREVDIAMGAGKAQKRLMELTKETSISSPRRSLTSALAAVASGNGHTKHATTQENVWDDNDFSFLLSDNIDEIQDSGGSFATDPMASSSGLDYEMEQFLKATSSAVSGSGDASDGNQAFDPNALLIAGEDHEPKFTQKEMELLVMLSASGIASEEMGMDGADGDEGSMMGPLNAMAGPSRQGHVLLDGNREWTDESSPWEISTPGGEQWKASG